MREILIGIGLALEYLVALVEPRLDTVGLRANYERN